jgi:hypothetical protein
MQRSTLIGGIFLGGVILFSAGVALGLHWRNTVAPVAPDTVREKSSPQHKEEPKPLQAAALAPFATGAAPSADLSPVVKDRLSMLVDLNERLQQKYGTSMLMLGRLNEDFVRVFDLTAAQQQELKTAIQTARDELGRIEASLARIDPRADGGFNVSVPPYPRDGGAVYDQFIDRMTYILGPERMTYARELHAIDFERGIGELHQFGLWRINIEVLPPAAGSSSWGTSMDSATGLVTQTGSMDLGMLKRTYPFLYERMRAAGQVPSTATP